MDIFLWKFSQTWARLLKVGGQEMEKRPRARALTTSPPGYRPPKQSFWRREKRGPNRWGWSRSLLGIKAAGLAIPCAQLGLGVTREARQYALRPRTARAFYHTHDPSPFSNGHPRLAVRTWAGVWPDQMPIDKLSCGRGYIETTLFPEAHFCAHSNEWAGLGCGKAEGG